MECDLFRVLPIRYPHSSLSSTHAKMMNKLMYRVPSGGNGLRNILPSKKPIQNRIIGGMYFDTGANDEGQPLLLPDESCLAEDERGIFKLQCEREGFHLFKWGGVNLFNVHAKIYLTNYRVLYHIWRVLTFS
jgi:hypothetical protein